MLVFALGLVAVVAPVTSAALSDAPDERVGAASAVNNAVSRAAGLVMVAVIPGFVGLSGDALSDPGLLTSGFGPALRIGAVIVAAGGLLAFVTLRERARREHHGFRCPVDGAHSHPIASGR